VPLIIAGRAVAPARRGARAAELVCSTDIWRTVAAAAGATDLPPGAGEDSRDLGPLLASPPGPGGRDFLFTESFRRNAAAGPYEEHEAAVRDRRFKLIHDVAAREATSLYDLEADPLERHDLLEGGAPAPDTEAGAALERLERAVREVLGS
jgi:arylsulfatase A-like enzyme